MAARDPALLCGPTAVSTALPAGRWPVLACLAQVSPHTILPCSAGKEKRGPEIATLSTGPRRGPAQARVQGAAAEGLRISEQSQRGAGSPGRCASDPESAPWSCLLSSQSRPNPRVVGQRWSKWRKSKSKDQTREGASDPPTGPLASTKP